MDVSYTHGIAFILEGDTEKVFYLTLLKHFCGKHPGYFLKKIFSQTTGEISYNLEDPATNILIKLYVVGTISQITNSGTWFENRCYSEQKSINWTVILCYDTDDYLAPISKFQEGDWKNLRKALSKSRVAEIIDMASNADIEDTMLLDLDSIFAFLEISPCPIPSGSKGKWKMKRLFRQKGSGSAYHEGERAADLINALDFDKIIALSNLPLAAVERLCFAE